MIYSIVTSTHDWESYVEHTVLMSTSLEVVQAAFKDLVEKVTALMYDLAIDAWGNCSEYYNVSEVVWMTARTSNEDLTITIRAVDDGQWCSNGPEVIETANLNNVGYFEDDADKVDHMFNLPAMSKYEILALPYQLHYDNAKSIH